MKPTREQIAEWVEEAGNLDICFALAYAAGRKAGMEFMSTVAAEASTDSENLLQQNGRLRGALRGLLDRYVELVNSGDAGFWDPEQEQVVIEARAAMEADN